VRILQINWRAQGGGAEVVSLNLHRRYLAAGLDARLVVGQLAEPSPGIRRLANGVGRGGWAGFWWQLDDRLGDRPRRGQRRLRRLLRLLADPGREWAAWRGREDMRYPGTWQLLRDAADRPDVIHAHNLHGGYFDLRALPWLSRSAPLVLTMHDAWLLSGHCAHSLECDRWKQGCGRCPDLSIYPALQRDGTAENWRAKRDLYAHSRLYLLTPCEWLQRKVSQSILAPAVAESRIIPNGVDLGTFGPGDKAGARSAVGLPAHACVLLFSANTVVGNVWKDYRTMRAALARLAEQHHGPPLLFVALGDSRPNEQLGRALIRFVPFESNPKVVALYYQAADIYVHAARADTFPNTVLEALACGTPVVATAVGGIPEQVDDGQDGFLVPAGDAAALAAALQRLVSDEAQRELLGLRGAEKAARRFDLARQAEANLEWYARAIGDFQAKAGAPA
jgi:glycosyltransferase involved in cell wall biosynthesis